jgi:hypothetical protein
VGATEETGTSYVLPLRWTSPGPIDDLAAYLGALAPSVDETLVVDSSPSPWFECHQAALRGTARHLRPHPDLRGRMGKVNGVITGVRESVQPRIVLADDDVRYDADSLRRVAELLDVADLVRPQNYFDELPWHAVWDTARSLLNRVFTGDLDFPVGDFPGTLAVRRETFMALGGYDGDVLFENLELMRTVRAGGGTVITPLDLYVARRPPETAHFLDQRIRQAYDDLGVPLRLLIFLSGLPLIATLAARRRAKALLMATLGSILIAESGRRRAGGTEYFPAMASILAPCWIAERSVCAWLAIGARLRGGAPYGQTRLRRPVTPMRRLRHRHRRAAGSRRSPPET